MKKILPKITYLIALILAIGPILGCGAINPYKRNSEGYYERHYGTCGPVALEKALNAYSNKHGIKYIRAWKRKEISQEIQSDGMMSKELLSFFNREAVCITWPSEIKKICNERGFDLITVNELDSLDPKKDIAIVLIHGRLFSKEHHWVVYPIDNVKEFYGNKTVIDKIYLLKWKKK